MIQCWAVRYIAYRIPLVSMFMTNEPKMNFSDEINIRYSAILRWTGWHSYMCSQSASIPYDTDFCSMLTEWYINLYILYWNYICLGFFCPQTLFHSLKLAKRLCKVRRGDDIKTDVFGSRTTTTNCCQTLFLFWETTAMNEQQTTSWLRARANTTENMTWKSFYFFCLPSLELNNISVTDNCEIQCISSLLLGWHDYSIAFFLFHLFLAFFSQLPYDLFGHRNGTYRWSYLHLALVLIHFSNENCLFRPAKAF